MNKKNLKILNEQIDKYISSYQKRKFQKLINFDFEREFDNYPYYFAFNKNYIGEHIVKNILDAHLSSGEETLFGDWLEGLAIYISDDLLKKGRKSSSSGIYLEIVDEKYHYLISIKSGPNWGNSSQISKLTTDFVNAKRSIKTSGYKKEVVFINGCCYGRKQNSLVKTKTIEYHKICGQLFWEFISGDENLYKDIIIPIGYKADKMNEEFNRNYSLTINRFTRYFMLNFCYENGEIDWDKFLKLSSSKYESNSLNLQN
jgi:hypothetical protein